MSDFQLVVWAIVIMFSLCAISFAIVGGIAFYRSSRGTAKSFGLMFERGNFTRLATAVLIILAAILLAGLGKLSSEGVAAILSGVAGYVLGGMERQPRVTTQPTPTDEGD